MKKILYLGIFLMVSSFAQTFTMDIDKTKNNQNQRNEHLVRETESPTSLRKNIELRNKEKKQQTLKRNQERTLKSSGESYNK